MLIPASEIPADVQQAKMRLGIIGSAPALIQAVQRAIIVAPIDLSVLITGESGTGKEFFPKIIHNFSARKHSKYIAVNCGAIPEGTIDSELFGHEKGSFTGAVATRKGYFEEADGGTIFLDEVAELPLTTQARLLRVLETGEFLKVGSSTVQKTNIRVVAATNVDMSTAIAEGRFREDLYYRLSTVQISIPPLRDRGNDVVLIARKFASDFAERYRTPQITLDDSAKRLMLSYTWPGNVRQLKNVIEQTALFEAGLNVDADILSKYLPQDAPMAASTTAIARHTPSSAYDREREMLFNLIFRLQGELSELRQQVSDMRAGVTAKDTKENALTQPIGKVNTPFAHTRSLTAPIIDVSASDVDPSDEPEPMHTANLAGIDASAPQTLEDKEKEAIRQSLMRNDGRRKAAAKELNISERTLYRKIKEYGLD